MDTFNFVTEPFIYAVIHCDLILKKTNACPSNAHDNALVVPFEPLSYNLRASLAFWTHPSALGFSNAM